MKLRIAIIAVIVAASVAAPFLVRHRARTELRYKHEMWNNQFQQLNWLPKEIERLSKEAKSDDTQQLTREQMEELLRLRNEVGNLRRQTNGVQQLADENRRLRASLTNSIATRPPFGTMPHDVVPWSEWTFAGNATPEAALKTAFSGEGDQSQSIRAISGPLGSFGLVNRPGYRVIGREVLSDDEVLLQLTWLESTNARSPVVRMKKVNGQWKLIEPR